MPRTLSAPLRLLCLLSLAVLAGCNPYTSGYKYASDPRETSVLAGDKAISTEILARFADNEAVGMTDLSASAYDGQVYLVGEYLNTAQLEAAKRIAAKVEGVRGVTVYARPRSEREDCSDLANLALAQEVGARLVADDIVHGYNVDVKALQCRTIVLLGLVADKAEIAQAKAVAAKVQGVDNVVSYLKVYTQQN
ncbi:BON domain-containing protein [Paucidesulfovibrio longus]|uniref:BON domain-containing protein n=1 Tax=Paucidesulfovibrio longus TaxID=889 RepID=UPI0003B45CD7|nr:BON domain-containing protein [Paucidesulfovibrio longus]